MLELNEESEKGFTSMLKGCVQAVEDVWHELCMLNDPEKVAQSVLKAGICLTSNWLYPLVACPSKESPNFLRFKSSTSMELRC